MRNSSRRRFRLVSIAVVGGLAIAVAARPAAAQNSPYPPQLPPGTAPATPAKNDVVPATYVAPLPQSPLPAAPQTSTVPLSPPAPLASGDGRATTRLPLPGADASANNSSRGGGWATVLASLGFVLGLFFVCARLLRRGLPQTARLLPKEAVETLGRMPLPGRRQGQLLRVGNKVVLVSFSAAAADVLVEIDDPAEIDRLAGLCAAADPNGATQSFRGIVEHFFRDKPGRADAARAPRGPESREDDVA